MATKKYITSLSGTGEEGRYEVWTDLAEEELFDIEGVSRVIGLPYKNNYHIYVDPRYNRASVVQDVFQKSKDKENKG